jgi:DNA-binding transcriptional LysR family regulator
MAQIDDLTGLRRGEVTMAIAEGAIDFVAGALTRFREDYPGIDLNVVVAGAQAVGDSVTEGQVELALTFNPPEGHGFRVERTMVYQLGAVVAQGHPLAQRSEVGFAECAEHGLVLPDESLSYRQVIDNLWARTVGGRTRATINANSIGCSRPCYRAGAAWGCSPSWTSPPNWPRAG